MSYYPRLNREKMRRLLGRLGFEKSRGQGVTSGHDAYEKGGRKVFISHADGDPSPNELTDFYHNLGLKNIAPNKIQELLTLKGGRAKQYYDKLTGWSEPGGELKNGRESPGANHGPENHFERIR